MRETLMLAWIMASKSIDTFVRLNQPIVLIPFNLSHFEWMHKRQEERMNEQTENQMELNSWTGYTDIQKSIRVHTGVNVLYIKMFFYVEWNDTDRSKLHWLTHKRIRFNRKQKKRNIPMDMVKIAGNCKFMSVVFKWRGSCSEVTEVSSYLFTWTNATNAIYFWWILTYYAILRI